MGRGESKVGATGYETLSPERADAMLGAETNNVLSKDNEYHDMRDALENYTYGGHDAENAILRGKDKGYDAEDVEMFKEDIKNIEKAIDTFETKANITVYRKTHVDSFKGMKTGDVFQDDGFVSTSTSEAFVKRFKGTAMQLRDDAYTMNIKVPKGKGKGVYVRNVSKYPEEYEFLLQRGTRFRVDEIDHTAKTMTVTIVGNERKEI